MGRMYKKINYRGYKAIFEMGYTAEKDIELLVYGIDINAERHGGRILSNLMHYSFDVKEEEKACHLELAVTYIPLQISDLVREGKIDSKENLEQELYVASLSAHSKNSRYLNAIFAWLKGELKWVYMKQDIPEMKGPMEIALSGHKGHIDRDLSQQ